MGEGRARIVAPSVPYAEDDAADIGGRGDLPAGDSRHTPDRPRDPCLICALGPADAQVVPEDELYFVELGVVAERADQGSRAGRLLLAEYLPEAAAFRRLEPVAHSHHRLVVPEVEVEADPE